MTSPSDNPLKRLIGEIHRRSLWQVLGIYVVASWAVLSVVDTLGGALNLPDWFPSVALALLIVGLPIVLATAFIQEGVVGRGVKEVAVAGPVAPHAAGLLTWRNAIGGGVLAFALLGFVGTGWILLGGGLRPTTIEQSIAVLPFDDLSAEGDQQYFVEGLSDEIINALTQIPDLKVAARTSTFILAEENASIEMVASALGVANVLEGSLRKSGDRVRITAQLIEASSGFHLWSETFDRDLTDIFEIQDAIARAIVEGMALPLGMGASESLVRVATADLDAYDLYLRARMAFANRQTLEDVDEVIRLYEQATSADPGYALAREGAAEAWAVRPNYSSEWASDLARAEEQAQAALSLDGTLTRARLVLASIHRDRWEWEEAERAYQLSLASLPNDPEAHHEYGEFLLDVGRCLEAAAEQRIALETDPLSSVFHFFLSMALLCDGQIDAGVAEGRRHQELGFPVGTGPFAFTLIEAGRVDEAVEYLQGTIWESYLRTAEALQDGIPEQNRFVTSSPLNEVWALALLGNQEAAITRMGAIIRAGPPMPFRGIWRPSIERLLGGDPRYQALLEQAGITW